MSQPHLPFGPRWFRPSPAQWERDRQASEERQRKLEEELRVHAAAHQARMKDSPLYRELYEALGAELHKYFKEMGWEYPEPKPGTAALPITESMRLLGLARPFTRDDVARAWKLRAAAVHPDRGGSAEKFIAMTRARDELLRGLVYA